MAASYLDAFSRDFLPPHLENSGYAVTIALGCVAFVLLLWRKIFEKHRYPPGPIPLPLLGNDYSLFAKDRATFEYENWSRYGNVVSCVSQGQWHVLLFGYDAIHEAFVKNADHFSDRQPPLSAEKSSLKPGLVFAKRWKDMRKQAIMVLRDHGMGKLKIEEKIRDELEYNFELFAAMKGPQHSHQFREIIGKAISNIISQIVFGRRLDYDDSNFVYLQKFDAFFRSRMKTAALPFYDYWPCDPLNHREKVKDLKLAQAFIRNEIQQHKAELDMNQPKDYIDTYLIEGLRTGDPLFADEGELEGAIIQLFLGGFDTTSMTLTWALLYLINYPSVQQRLHEEITLTIGSRQPCIADRDSLPFTQSFIHELLRCAFIAGRSLPHLCTQDTAIQGKTIPKGTVVFAHLSSSAKEIYEEPDLFKAERFLDDEGRFVKPKGRQMLPFSIGRRACPGESLARTELFIILVSFLQKFEVKRLAEELESEEGIDIFTRSPKPFQFDITQRV